MLAFENSKNNSFDLLFVLDRALLGNGRKKTESFSPDFPYSVWGTYELFTA